MSEKHEVKPTWEDTKDSLQWTLFTVLGSLPPLYVGGVILAVGFRPLSLLDLVSHGEFALYSAALIGPAFYLILKDLRIPFPKRTWFGLGALLFLILAIAVWAGVIAFSRGEAAGGINRTLVAVVSIPLYVLSLGLAFVVNLFDRARAAYDIRTIKAEQYDDLQKTFRTQG